ncbi:MAG: 4Fe-4S dicluster domain-containing protein [Alphaproteobacteria bacterium]|nr:4Fe-4S dicluster domain-containing protein [Alphaproteobacteria bacterium]
MTYLKYLRWCVSAVVLILCVLAFSGKFYDIKIFNIQLTALAQSALLNTSFCVIVLLTCLLVITLIFGRIYCSALCPLGIFQELLMLLFKPVKKILNKNQTIIQKHYGFSYILSAVGFGGLLGGTVVIIRHFDPYSVLGNAVGGGIYGIIFITLLTIFVFFKNRFFCTNICPIGALLGWISRCSLFKIRINQEACVRCAKCAQKCPSGSIDFKNSSVNNETCIKCFNCLGSCHRHALTYGLKKNDDIPFEAGRREFLVKSGAFILLALAFKSGLTYSKRVGQKFKKALLPAGAGSTKEFANHCLNCNLCVQNCPMKIIKKANRDFPVVHLDYSENHCDYNCHRCSEICPSGALKPLTLKQKQNTKLGTAQIDSSVCVKCGLCVIECPRKVITKKAGKHPVINIKECIGCGACQNACPVKAINVKPIEKQRLI